MRLIFNIVAMVIIFIISFAGTMAGIAGIGISVLGFEAREMQANINAFIGLAIIVSGFVTWGIYEQELKQ